jgi:hypothetical protein
MPPEGHEVALSYAPVLLGEVLNPESHRARHPGRAHKPLSLYPALAGARAACLDGGRQVFSESAVQLARVLGV